MTTSLLAAAHRGRVVLADVTINPNGGGAPGGQQLGQIINYIAFYALLACAAGFLASSIVWALGSRTGNYGAAQGGKTGVITTVGVAFLVGAAAVGVDGDVGQDDAAAVRGGQQRSGHVVPPRRLWVRGPAAATGRVSGRWGAARSAPVRPPSSATASAGWRWRPGGR